MGYDAGSYDIAVVGAGHAGCEAALAAARLGLRTLLFAINLDSIANMPCNPSIGGTAKSQLVREVDALGGEMGRAADHTTLLSGILNASKGPAVYSLRAQTDRRRYQMYMKKLLEDQPNLFIRQAEVTEILFEQEGLARPEAKCRATGVKTLTGAVFQAKAVVLATGTYLKGKIIIGDVSYSGGPDGLFPASSLSACLKNAGIRLMRFKTGTPARIKRDSIDFAQMTEQPGDARPMPFSFDNEYDPEWKPEQEQLHMCWLTCTNERTHGIIRENLHRSPLFSGTIEGRGPRYCPSIEDKVVRFADKERHQVFVEPMGRDTGEMYLQGMSSSLPEDVQVKMVQSLAGLSHAFIMRPAYAIEYDCIDPLQLTPALEFKEIEGLFSAGQLNGSSGYEEAAAQGLMAGINAAQRVLGKPPVVLSRAEAYIGVLIDDLVTKGTEEPYRMMTSRAEYRLLLRQDNADLRLTPLGYRIGLITESRCRIFNARKDRIMNEIQRLKEKGIPPSQEVNAFLDRQGSARITTGTRLADLLRRPELCYGALAEIDADRPRLDRFEAREAEISIKYEGYIRRELEKVDQMKKLEGKRIPADMDYEGVRGLRKEAAVKLSQIRPLSLGQASRISGVSPADISLLMVYLELRRTEAARTDRER
ncbi:MAG TPA: tRNA uridine-5-carboxymethylaminomethyl(34) synthesis enzyme MnmG [Clostridiales bacterium]|nr:tRNA uridine-5-carboxymethylaminomethyl(34) synthesis enzyme MnmG [Clostridiales bacterium]